MTQSLRILSAILATFVVGSYCVYDTITQNSTAYQSHPAVAVITAFWGASLSGLIVYFGSGWLARRKERKLKQAGDDKFYDEVARELQDKPMVPGLWTKAFAEMGGDDAKARALYIKYRVAQLAEAGRQQLEKDRLARPQQVESISAIRARYIKVILAAAILIAIVVLIAVVANNEETPQTSVYSPEKEHAEREYTFALIDYSAKEYTKAFKRFCELADQNNVEAQGMLGVCYQYGNGVAKDEIEAVKWYRKAAEQGNDSAQLFLGECYELGIGVQTNDVEAFKWYSLAAAQGDKSSKKYLADIAGHMTPEQIAEGQRLTKVFVTKKAD